MPLTKEKKEKKKRIYIRARTYRLPTQYTWTRNNHFCVQIFPEWNERCSRSFGGGPPRGVENLAGQIKTRVRCRKEDGGGARTEGTMKESETSRVENDGRGSEERGEGGKKVEEKPKRNQGED